MKTFSITDVGMVRQVNQDYVYMTDNPLAPLPNLFVVIMLLSIQWKF